MANKNVARRRSSCQTVQIILAFLPGWTIIEDFEIFKGTFCAFLSSHKILDSFSLWLRINLIYSKTLSGRFYWKITNRKLETFFAMIFCLVLVRRTAAFEKEKGREKGREIKINENILCWCFWLLCCFPDSKLRGEMFDFWLLLTEVLMRKK